MMPLLFRASACIALLLLATRLAWGGSSPNERVSVERVSESRLLITLKPYEINISPLEVEGRKYHQIFVTGYGVRNLPGSPEVPTLGLLAQVPPGAEVTISILEVETDEIEGQFRVLPSAAAQTDLKANIVDYLWDEGPAYSSDSFWPHNIIEHGREGKIRGVNLFRIGVNPIQYNPIRKTIRRCKKLRFQVDWSSTSAEPSRAALGVDSQFIRAVGPLLLNPSAALYHQTRSNVPGENWYNTDYSYFKLDVNEDGVYSVGYDDLIDAGLKGGIVETRNAKVINRGEQIPIWIDGPTDGIFDDQNQLRFLAERNRQEGLFNDMFTDDNVYWLTFDGEAGKRYDRVEAPPPATESVPFYWDTLHVEKDLVFYRWNIASTYDDGEGWIWRYLFEDEKESIGFRISGHYEPVATCTVRVVVKGTTLDPVEPDHHVVISVNDVQIHEAFFDNRETASISIPVPNDMIRNGENNLSVKLLPTFGTVANQILLDWVEIIYPRSFAARDDGLRFSHQAGLGKVAEVAVSNFAQPDPIILHSQSGKLWKPRTQRASIPSATSAAFDDGNFVQFEVDFETRAFQGIGHYLLVINRETGQTEVQNFDTHNSSAAADAMAEYIQALPDSSIVLAGIVDEGSGKMTDAAHGALEMIGSSLSRGVGFRDSWAIVGWKGASTGTVAETVSKRFSGPAVASDTLHSGLATRYIASFIDTMRSGFYYCVTQSKFQKPRNMRLDLPSNLRNPDLGADYVVITHREFWESAKALADYRKQHNAFRTFVVDAEDIYDEFNYGIVSPVAIKEFLKYTYTIWLKPAPMYVVLLGDASWDPKRLMPETSKTSYVPAYGDPVADNWFVTLDSGDDILPDMHLGRIPVETSEQAQVLINKIIDYEESDFSSWNKEFLFFNGGFNDVEQTIFRRQATELVDNYVGAPPLFGTVRQANKMTEEVISLDFREIAAQKIKEGVLWANFIGHAASSVWDIDIGGPSDWQNTIFPFMTGMSCHSARFANPIRNSLSEEYVLDRQGAIAYWGASGFGYITQDFFLLQGLFSSVSQGGVRSIGEATSLAKLFLWGKLGESSRNRNVINQYVVIGDPALRLSLSAKPELAVNAADIAFSRDFLLATDSTETVGIKIRNYGPVSQDSVEVDISHTSPAGAQRPISVSKMAPVKNVDSLFIEWPIPKQAGTHLFAVRVDPHDLIEESSDANNSAVRRIDVFLTDLTTIKPLNYGVVNTSPVALVTTNSRLSNSETTYHFEIDQADTFNSSLLVASPPLQSSGLVARWETGLPEKGVYYWRVRSFDGSDFGAWRNQSFLYEPSATSSWTQTSSSQFEENEAKNLSFVQDSVVLSQNTFVFGALSQGFLDGNLSELSVNGIVVEGNHRGHNLAVFDETTGELLATVHFDTHSDQNAAEEMAQFIIGLKPGRIVLVAIDDEGSDAMTENAHLALEAIGSSLTRQVGARDSWAIIGKKGASTGSVPEELVKAGEGGVAIEDTVTLYNKTGVLGSPEIGPSTGWGTAGLDLSSIGEGAELRVKIFGRNRVTGRLDSLLELGRDMTQVDLSAIDASHYRTISLVAEFASNDGLSTPVLHYWSADFIPPPDLVIGNDSIEARNDTVQVGDDIEITATVGNWGITANDSCTIRVFATPKNATESAVAEARLDEIAAGDSKPFKAMIPSSDLDGEVRFRILVDADDEIPEINETNNTVSTNIWVERDTLRPEIRITFDGRAVAVNEFVSSKPEIVVEVRDLARVELQDTSRVTILLDGRKIGYGPGNGQATFLPAPVDEADLRASVLLSPELTPGEHEISVAASDNSDNRESLQTTFFVSDEFILANVMNYPNPFSSGTDFTYVLTRSADQVSIKVYTVAGRLILNLNTLPGQVGFNRYFWDGRDRAGDRLANGVYLYKIIAQRDGRQQEVVEKLAIVR